MALDAAAQAGTVDTAELQAKLREPLTEWRGLLRKHVAQARQILRKLFLGRDLHAPH